MNGLATRHAAKGRDVTRTFLLCGMIAGPIYVIVAGLQVLTRDGFDITRHPVSLLSLGDWGWIQIANFVVCGSLILATAFGLRQVLTSGHGARWGPILVGAYGIGLVLSGIFVADAMDGFPPGTPPGDPEDVTLSGILHLISGAVAFLSLVAACVVFSRRFSALAETGWSRFSIVAGALLLVAFLFIGMFPGEAFSNLLLTAGVVLGWAWLTLLSRRYLVTAPASAPGAVPGNA